MRGEERAVPADVLQRIVAARRDRIRREGPNQHLTLPATRPAELPVVPFPQPLICEIKRRSPSRGLLAADIDPVKRAGHYRDAGAGAVSVLTEQDHFGGSLANLVAVKEAYPDLAVLRKDFLFDVEDVTVAWRAGADAVLLIAGILSTDEMAAMLAEAARLGLAALVEVHDSEEVARVRPLAPPVIGINSRDLRTFRVDLLTPLALAGEIDWPATLVFESGIFHREDAELAREGGFAAVLVGEAVVRDPAVASTLRDVMARPSRGNGARPFWPFVARRPRPLVKICGITNLADAREAERLGADMLGLVYAPSPRRAPDGLPRQLVEAGIRVPLVAVVVEPGDDGHVERAQADRDAGWISALQLHGEAAPEAASSWGTPYFAALRPHSAEEARDLVLASPSIRLLVDARDPARAGGTGKQADPVVVDAVLAALAERPHGSLWLAGGLGADNIAEVIDRYQPELVDASSRLEAEPGRKDHELLRQFFEAIGPRDHRGGEK
jgi:indole-3-glycerol phosphate synthase/phosphoribosylanthranilate isomerase